ncbi:MAG: PaaI family thioesterase [Acidobacteria bacterium]|jgi:acyl-CoA thioesterase|nr:PaaI family thioesterase [Acidobacteriota bacterium]
MKNNEITESQKQRAFEAAKTIPFVNLIGMELTELGGGEAIFKLQMREELRQPHGLLHGGATASLIDTTMAFAVITCLAENEKASTVDLTVHYLRPLIDGTITCTAKVVKTGKRLLTVSADVVSDKEKLIATAISTYSKV